MKKYRYAAITVALLLAVGMISSSFLSVPLVNAASDFSVSASPSSINVSAGNLQTSTISITSNGFSGTVQLSSSVSPGNPTITASLNPSAVAVTQGKTGTSTLTVTTTPFTSLGLYTVTVTGTSGSLSHTTQVFVTVLSGTVGATSQIGTVSTPPSIELSILLVVGTAALLGLYLRRTRTPALPWI